MKATLDTLFAEALTLPDEARLQLVERLIPTIHSEPSLEAEQIQEVRRRIDQVRSGRVRTLPGEQVFRKLTATTEMVARRAAALEEIRRLNPYRHITDPVAWQREMREDRPLPGRD